MPKALFNLRQPFAMRGGFGVAVVAAALSSSGAASAADFSIGIGAGADRGHADCIASMPCDRSSAGGKLFAGYRIADSLDVQAAYFGAGHFHGGDTTPLGTDFGGTFKVSGFSVTGGYAWKFMPGWDVTGRVGLAVVRTRFDYADDAFASVSKTTVQPAVGIGVGYAITPSTRVSLDDDLTRFKVHTTQGSLQTLGLSARFAF